MKIAANKTRAYIVLPEPSNERQQAIWDFLNNYPKVKIIMDAVPYFAQKGEFVSKSPARKYSKSITFNITPAEIDAGDEDISQKVIDIVSRIPFKERTDFVTSAVYDFLMNEAEESEKRRFLLSDVVIDGEEFDLLGRTEYGKILLPKQSTILCAEKDIDACLQKWLTHHKCLREHIKPGSLRLLTTEDVTNCNVHPLENGEKYWIQKQNGKHSVVDALGLVRKRIPEGTLAYIRPVFVYSEQRNIVSDAQRNETLNVSDHLDLAKQAEDDMASGKVPVIVGKDRMIKEIIAAREMCSISNKDFLMLCKKHGIESEIKIS